MGSDGQAQDDRYENPILKRKLAPNEMFFNKSKKLSNLSEGSKFLVIKRKDNGKNMADVSIFLIEHSINSLVGKIKSFSRISDGTILIQTFTAKQASTLVTLERFDSNTNVTIEEHERLNQSKGFIICDEFKILTDDEILIELANQNVVAIKRNKRKNFNDVEIETGSYVLTFSSSSPPEFINVGYLRVHVRDFIPPPLRCFICLKFGHHKSKCEKEQVIKKCFNCGDDFHTAGAERCVAPARCVNCGDNHPSTSKSCPKYIKELEITKIKIQERISFREAVQIYNERFPTNANKTFSSVVNPSKKQCNCQCNCGKSSINDSPVIATTSNFSGSSKIVTTTKIIESIKQDKRKNNNNLNDYTQDPENNKKIAKNDQINKNTNTNKTIKKTIKSRNGDLKMNIISTLSDSDIDMGNFPESTLSNNLIHE